MQVIENYHHLSIEKLEKKFKTNISSGLKFEEADERLKYYGENLIKGKKQRNAFLRFLDQFNNPLIYILLAASILSLFLEEWVDGVVIFGVVIINAIIGFVQENKAVEAISALADFIPQECTVLREGKTKKIKSKNVVLGDILIVNSGDRIAADMRIIQSKDLKVDESSLTGESVSVEKNSDILEEEKSLSDRNNMAYGGTIATYGQATGIVVAIGNNTEVGKISDMIDQAEDLATPLTIKINQFSKILLFVIIGLAVFTFSWGVFRGGDYSEMFMAAIALMVGAIPEGLPAAITIMLSIGVSRMASRNAIIRKLPAVETLGSTNIICSDKTGTLTENKMTVQKVFAGNSYFNISGTGYQANGDISPNYENHKAFNQTLLCGILCNDSKIALNDKQQLFVEGDPTEGALIVAAEKAGYSCTNLATDFQRLDSIPFESEYQYMATIHQREDENIIYIKGSFEAISSRSKKMLDDEGNIKDFDLQLMEEKVQEMAGEGLRVLAFAFKKSNKSAINHQDIDDEIIFCGLQGMIDPPRQEAMKAIKKCYTAGISVKMITGDHAFTAVAIAKKLGIKVDEEIETITGKELSKLDDEELMQVVEKVNVFARVSPEQKLKLVNALQKLNHVIAMTGDGVNDAPALKQANIGIAMGITGTDVAKDASDMILLDDNFASIEAAIEEGRTIFDNLVKFIVWTLPTNLGEGLILLLAIIFGGVLPMAPVQILYINMFTSVLLGLTLVFEPKEIDIMERPPRKSGAGFISFALLMRTLFVGAMLLFCGYGIFLWEMHQTNNLELARTATVTAFVVLETFYLFNCRSMIKPLHGKNLFSNPWVYYGATAMIILQLMFVYLPVMNSLFGSAPLPLFTWLKIFAAGILVFILVNIEKRIRLKFETKKAAYN